MDEELLQGGVANEGAVVLLDFDFAAPGRRVFDLASFARMWVPIDDEINGPRPGWAEQKTTFEAALR